MATVSENNRPGVKRENLPDEMPRSSVSGDRVPHLADHRHATPALVWMLLAFLVVAGFAGLLWLLHPPSEHLGKPSADVVAPAGPPIRKP